MQNVKNVKKELNDLHSFNDYRLNDIWNKARLCGFNLIEISLLKVQKLYLIIWIILLELFFLKHNLEKIEFTIDSLNEDNFQIKAQSDNSQVNEKKKLVRKLKKTDLMVYKLFQLK